MVFVIIMNITTVMVGLLLGFSAAFANAEVKLMKSPADGIVELSISDRFDKKRVHYLNSSQIVRVYSRDSSMSESGGGQYSTTVVIATTEIETASVLDFEGARRDRTRGFSFHLGFKTEEEAKIVVASLLAEIKSLGK